MLRPRARIFCALLVWTGGLRAQTFVVDASNGPGTNFTEIATAVSAVASGSTLLVRPGQYLPFTIAAKAMTVLADPGVFVTGTAIVNNTQALQTVIVRGLDFTAPTLGVGSVIHVHDCDGLLLLEDLATPPAPAPEPLIASYWYTPRGLAAQRCSQLVVRNCTIASAVISECESVLEACTFRGPDQFPTGGIQANALEGLSIGEGRCDVVGDTVMIGGAAFPGGAQPPGLRTILADARIHSGRVEVGNGGPGWAVYAVSSQLRIDPSVVLVSGGWPPIIGAAAIVAMSEVVSTGAPPGGAIQATVATAPNDLVALFVGAVGAPMTLPGWSQRFWLDPSAVVLQAVGVQQAGAPLRATLAVPNLATLRGARVVWQGLTLGLGAVAMTNPSVALVH